MLLKHKYMTNENLSNFLIFLFNEHVCSKDGKFILLILKLFSKLTLKKVIIIVFFINNLF